MTLQEREQLELFLRQLTQVQTSQKDTEADGLIREACARQPDAGYLLVQRAMQLEHALEAQKAQYNQLQAELDRTRSGAPQSGFLNNASAWGSAPIVAASAAAAPGSLNQTLGQSPSRTLNQPPAQGASPAAAPAAAAPSAWGSGILGTVATTAAGVVAGSFLYQGISSMMGHHNTGTSAASDTTAKSAAAQTGSNETFHGFDDNGTADTTAFADVDSDFGGEDVA